MKKLKIFYDYQIMLLQKYGGISRYYFELLSRINLSDSACADAYCIGNKNAYFASYYNAISNKHLRGVGILNRLVALKKLKIYDIVHPTYYHPYILKSKYNKLVITVYDMIHELFPQMFSKNDKTAENKKKLIYGADHIIAISENTKKDILKLYPDISSDKITVIYIGSNMVRPPVQANIILPEKYILFVGNRDGYKNFATFFRSVRTILLKDPDLSLLCLGGGRFNEAEQILIKDVAKQVVQMDVFDADLAYAYSKALCFVFPSQYEGFGIPTLEAFGCDCPVVLSNSSSMPEVGGDAVVYIDPNDEKDMHDKILQVISDANLRQQMILKGRNQLSKFNWDNIANETINCYKKVVGGIDEA